MITTMDADATPEEIQGVIDKVIQAGMQALNLPGGATTVIGVASSIPPNVWTTSAASRK